MNEPRYTTAKSTSTRTEPEISTETPPAASPTMPAAEEVGTKLGRLEPLEVEVVVEEVVEVVEVVVVVGGAAVVVGGCQVVVGDGGGCQVVVGGCQVVVGGGGGCEVVVGAGAGSDPEPKFQVPVRTPAEMSAKNSKSPCEKSRPLYGHPGHSSVI
jgi:hypothetical protein